MTRYAPALAAMVMALSVSAASRTLYCPMGMTAYEMREFASTKTVLTMKMLHSQDPPDSPRGEPSEDEIQDPNTPQPPEGNPNHVQPTEFCTSTAPPGKMPCMCIKWAPEGCKDGQRDVESRTCHAWCWKSMCRCCAS